MRIFKKKEEKNKVGRPKLADNPTKKKSLIISGICLVLVMVLLFGGLVSLNIMDFSKLKGSVTTESEELVNTCLVETVSDSYIRLTGNIFQDYGDTGIATMTFTSNNKILTKEINVKTDSNTPFDIAIPKGEYTLTITKENYKTYELAISETKNISIGLKYDPTKRIYNIGDEICLESECFYVMSDDGTNIKAMAKYNLLVGNEVVWPNTDFNDYTSLTPIDPSTPGYGHQTSSAKAALIDNTVWTGTIEFAKELDEYNGYGYWTIQTGEQPWQRGLNPDYGSEYPAWVFDSNSSLWTPIQNYKSYLQSLGYTNINVTLPSYNDMITLGCDGSEYSCENAPSWVYETTYWLGSAGDNYGVWSVASNGDFSDYGFYFGSYLGLRPVITILKSDL